MKIIHRINDVEIYKIVDETYAILSINTNKNLAAFLNLLEIDSTIASDKEVKIKCNSVVTLEKFLSQSKNVLTYNQATKFALDVVKQILYLEGFNKTLSYLSSEDIVVIDNNKFLILNEKNMYEIKKNHIQVDSPYVKTFSMGPAMRNGSVLPLKLYYTEVYYSIGLLLIYCLYNEKYSDKQLLNLREIIGSIYATRLYWFIEKSLIKNPKGRKLLFF